MASILVIEDEARTARSIVDELTGAGHAVNWAPSGKAGLTHAQSGAVDLVTLDRLLPDIDGLALLGEMRQRGVTAPVLVVSALDLTARQIDLLEFLMRRAGSLVTRSMLFEAVWDYKFDPGTNLIDVHMGRLRRKLDGPGDQPMITTVRGAGWILDEPG